MRPIGPRSPRAAPNDRVDVEQEHRDLQGLGLGRVRPPAELRMADSVAGVVLAAGAGTRLRPLTRLRPKALCPVGNVAAGRPRHRAARRPSTGDDRGQRAPRPRADGAAPVARRPACTCRSRRPRRSAPPAPSACCATWIDGRPVLVVNADAWLPVDLRPVRRRAGTASGSGCWWSRTGPDRTSASPRYCGVALLPWADGRRPRAASRRASTRCAGGTPSSRPARPRRPRRARSSTAARPADYLRRQPAGQRRRVGDRRRAPGRADGAVRRAVGGVARRGGRAPGEHAASTPIRAGDADRARAVRADQVRTRAATVVGPQLAAGGVDVGAAVAADGGVHAEGPQPVAEGAHAGGRRARASGSPGVGLSGIRLTWARSGRAIAASSPASVGRSLTPSMSAHSNDSRRRGGGDVRGGRPRPARRAGSAG